MSIATARTAKFGGAASTFVTAASPGAKLTATLFAAIDTALLAAGWTSLYTNISTIDTNIYASTGESGTESMFLVMRTGAMGTASGSDIAGGSWLTCGLAQWADSGGNYFNVFGIPHNASGDPIANTVLELEPSLTWDYVIVADKDGIDLATVPTTSHPNTPYFIHTGILRRAQGINPVNLVTSATISLAGGTNVSVNVTADPIAAGYKPGDIVAVIAQNAGAVGKLADIFATRLVSLTTSSVILEWVPALSANMVSGALIGEDPQPFYGNARNTGFPAAFPNNNGLGKCSPWPGFGLNSQVNMWTTQQGSSAGDQVNNNSNAVRASAFAQGGLSADATVRPDARTGAYYLDTFGMYDTTGGGFAYRGKLGRRCYLSAMASASLPGSLTISYARRQNVSGEEWVGFGVNTAGMGQEAWMGPFSVVNSPTKKIVLVDAESLSTVAAEVSMIESSMTSDGYESTAIGEIGVWAMDADYDAQTGPMIQAVMNDQGGTTSSDDVQPVLVDQPYPFDYTYMPSSQESPNFNRGMN